MTTTTQLGLWGESVALQWFTEQGFTLWNRRWRRQGVGELDLVLFYPDQSSLHLLEVKTTRSTSIETPASLLTPTKVARWQKAAELYIAQLPAERQGLYQSIQFDWLIIQQLADTRSQVHYFPKVME
jgi:Holliday junction resolvase-like predicted endonuclease